MHRAPAVEVTVGADRAARAALGGLAGAAAASLGAWVAALASMSGLGVGGWALAAGVVGALVGWRWRPAPVQLRWDGRAWSLLPPDATAPDPGRVRVAIDLDGWLLLRFDGTAGRRWLALSRAAHRPAWHALRCALQAHGGERDPMASAQV
jgi:hypothetical protein